jgi:hypothetical protein
MPKHREWHIDTIGPSTFFLSILVLIFTPEYAIKISCGSSGTTGILYLYFAGKPTTY